MEEIESECNPDQFCLFLFRNFDEGTKHIISDSPINIFKIENFINIYKEKTIMELTTSTYPTVFGNKKELILLICEESNCEYYKDIFIRFAFKFKESFRFAYINDDAQIRNHMIQFLNLQNENFPVVRILEFEYRNILKYKSKDEDMFREIQINKFEVEQVDKLEPLSKEDQIKKRLNKLRASDDENDDEEENEDEFNDSQIDQNENSSNYFNKPKYNNSNPVSDSENPHMIFLEELVEKYFKKQLKPYYRSEETTEYNVEDDKVFYPIVSDNFEELVIESDPPFVVGNCILSFDYCIELKKSLKEIGRHLVGYGNVHSRYSN